MDLIGDKPQPSRFRLVVVVTSIVVGMYVLAVWLPFYFFRSDLAIADVIAPDKINPLAPFQIGFKVANSHWGDGAAYVSLVIEGETEIEGPVIPIPAREARDIFVTVSLETGTRAGSLVLYDAGYNNRLDARHGIALRVGSPPIRIVRLNYDPVVSQGDTMTIILSAVVDDAKRYEIIPFAILYDSQGGRPIETDGVEHIVKGDSNLLRIDLTTARLPLGPHRLTVGLYDPEAKRRIGKNNTHNEFVVTGGLR